MNLIDLWQKRFGKALAYLNLFTVAIVFILVSIRAIFGIGWVWMQELALYSNAILFLGVSGYALLCDEHVRIDIFYRDAKPKTKAWVNLLGALILLLPVIGLIAYHATPYILESWRVREGSGDAGGLPAVFLLKTMIWVFCASLILQALSLMIHSARTLRGASGSSR
jgi:TRAP-type mannitol/chloroaromatic compound transport system permease small subunit